MPGPDGQRLLVNLPRLGKIAGLAQQYRQMIIGIEIVRVGSDGLLQSCTRLVRLPKLLPHNSQVQPRAGQLGSRVGKAFQSRPGAGPSTPLHRLLCLVEECALVITDASVSGLSISVEPLGYDRGQHGMNNSFCCLSSRLFAGVAGTGAQQQCQREPAMTPN